MSWISVFFTRKKPIANRCFTHLMLPILLLIGQTALVEDAAAASLTLQQAIERSLTQHPQLEAMSFRAGASQAQINQAKLRTATEVQFEVEDALGSGVYEGADSAQATLSLSWALEGKQIDSRVGAAEARQSLVTIELERQRFDVGARTAQAFLTALSYQERLAVAEGARDSAAQSLEEIRRRGRAGGASRVDVLRTEVELRRRELDVEDLEHELAIARQQLAAQWGNSDSADFELLGQLQTNQTLVSMEDLKVRLKDSPRVKIFLTRARVNESEMAIAKSDALASWRFSAGVRRYEATDDFGVVAGVAIPLGKNRRNEVRVSELQAKRSVNQAMAISEESRLKARLFELYQALQHSRHQTSTLHEEIIPRLQKAVAEANKAYSVGRFTYLEWQSVKQELLDARLALISAQLSSHVNLTEIERLTGISLSANSKEKN
ncbi:MULTISPECIES: TolC family protein [Alcanivorax]|jgi:cobalt-zinc-cadmium efflux system outer membrane protein|uniref:Outer membrane efflux protein n=2 Tax=Alcanivorax TaxID=59753 RepID=A0ABR4WD66_9GAMM|nr:TolC family protein [Alcanivorax jadensis]KGD61432.1 outer membrane efflux protein [Alcanivorax jadensis T9]HIL21722.1 TolC family protein [Alcanivorax sp.]